MGALFLVEPRFYGQSLPTVYVYEIFVLSCSKLNRLFMFLSYNLISEFKLEKIYTLSVSKFSLIRLRGLKINEI